MHRAIQEKRRRMNERIASKITIVLLLISTLTLTYHIQPAEATETIYIKADGSIEPLNANITRNGDLYTLTGNITSGPNDGIVIERNNMTLDGAGYTIKSGWSGLRLGGRNNVTIRNIRIEDFYYGISINNSSNITISGSYISGKDTFTGIYFITSSNSEIYGNTFTHYDRGIDAFGSSNNSIHGNYFTANTYSGILIGDSSNNNVFENNMTNNRFAIQIGMSSTNNTVTRNLMTNNTSGGILFTDSENNTVSENTITANSIGVFIESRSHRNNISRNDIGGNNYGVYFDAYSEHNNIVENNITNNKENGVTLYRSSYNNILSNNITANNDDGVHLDVSYSTSSTYNTIARNYISSNNRGVYLNASSSNNMISENTITKNVYGFFFNSSSDNLIYHNNIIANTIQVYTINSVNLWNGSFCEGNYWSNYLGTDADGDGIGDTPYTIDGSNRDNYPLMQPWMPVHNINTGLSYATIQEAINANKTLNGHTILVEAGTYHEHVIINKTISLVGENRDTTIIDGDMNGTVVTISANNVKISGFTIQNGGKEPWTNFGACIQVMVLSNNSVVCGNVLKGSTMGIEVEGFGSLITDNVIEDNYKGIDVLFGLGNNTIARNTITTSIWYGIEIIYSSNNTILHNNFIDNNQSTYSTGSINAWDNGWEGNHWSDYTGVDLDHDGIGDSPYTIFSTTAPNQDRYPLMNRYISGDYSHDGIVNMTDASFVEQAWQSREGERSYNPHADFNMDGIINIKDAAIIGVNWLKKWED
jgi:parallel beta-helix repeat protein